MYGLYFDVDTAYGREVVPVSLVGRPDAVTQGKVYSVDELGSFAVDLAGALKKAHRARHIITAKLCEGTIEDILEYEYVRT